MMAIGDLLLLVDKSYLLILILIYGVSVSSSQIGVVIDDVYIEK
jgi:type III secretory pathway component EscS